MASIDPAEAGRIVGLAASDAPALCPLSDEAGWNQVAGDWRLMLGLGQGFGQRENGRWIGSALTLPLAPSLCWISMVLVTSTARGRGLGTELLARCLAAADASGRVAGLDATEFGRPIYLPLGFRDVFALSRWYWPAPAPAPVDPPVGIAVRALTAADLAPICAYDAALSGLARPAILADLWRRSTGFGQLAIGRGGVKGFVLGRDGRSSWHIGPIVAEDEATALALLSAAAAALTAPVIVDIPDHHRQLGAWLGANGAVAPRRFMRMLRGDPPAPGEEARIFALAGPELG